MYNIDATVIGRPTTARQRVRALFGLLSDQHGPTIRATLVELASTAHTQPEHVSREIAALCRAGVLRREGPGVVTVLDRSRLEA